MMENAYRKQERVASFLRKVSGHTGGSLADDMENFGESERESLYGIIYEEEERKKQAALDDYIEDFQEIKKKYEDAESKMRQLAKKMEDLLKKIR